MGGLILKILSYHGYYTCELISVNSSYLEPKPGFNDTLYGVMGLIAGFSMGILRIFIGDKKLPVSIVPLDYCANIATVLAYQVAKDNQQ